MSDLFRSEAVDYRRRRLLGSVIVQDSALTNYFICALAVISIALVLWGISATYARTEIVRGSVVTRQTLAKVYPPRNGIVEALLVADGDLVRAGQTLAVISVDSRAGSGEPAAGFGFAALERQIISVTDQSSIVSRALEFERVRIQEAIEKNDEEQKSLHDQQTVQEEIVKSSEMLVEVIRPLVEKGVVSRLESEKRKQIALQEKQKFLQLTQLKIQNENQRRQYFSQLKKADTDSEKQRKEIQASLEALEQQRAKLRAEISYSIVAPSDGRITSMRTSLGRYIDPRSPIFAIVPNDAVFDVELFAPTIAVGFLRVGHRVRVMYDAFPYRKFGSFGGTVTHISRSIINPGDLDAPIKIEEAVYQLRAALDNQLIHAYGVEVPLQAGMTLQASIILEKRTFVDWLIEPFRAVQQRH